jgi:3-hydroxyisobutyrate dehydrogenase
MSKTPIALLGLGIMGTGMARRLLGAGFPLAVYNRSAAKAEALGKEGAQVAASPRDAAKGAQIILSMVAEDSASRQIWLGDHGALAGAPRGAVLVESSTVSVGWVKELAEAAQKHGCELLDAPVTGSKAQAAAGELTYLVGGSDDALAKARPALAVMSKEINHLGPTGSGSLMKLINNFVCGVQVAALAEALALIERTELDRDKALAVLTNGAPGSPLVKTVSARMTARNYTPNFFLRLMAKDLLYARDEAEARSMELETDEAALRLFKRAMRAGHGDQDMASVIEPMRKT